MDSYTSCVREACETGDTASIRRLLRSKDAPASRPGQKLQFRDRRLVIDNMLIPAINHRQASVVQIILTAYPNFDIYAEDILLAASGEKSHLPTFKVLYTHCPEIGMYCFNSRATPLVELCARGDPAVADYLLDQGVDPNEGGLPTMGALFYAVYKGRPISLIKKLVQKGAIISDCQLESCIRYKNHGALVLLLEKAQHVSDPEGLLNFALEAEDKTAAEVMQMYIDEHRVDKKAPRNWRFWKK